MPTPKQLANLKPPKKGEVRNPKGKAPGTLSFKTILLEISEQEAPEKVVSRLRKAGHTISTKTYKRVIAHSLINEAVKGNVQAIKEYADRTDGPVKQEIELTGNLDNTSLIIKPKEKKADGE